MTQHTILLLQLNKNVATRTWAEFPTLAEALEEIIRNFETQLKYQNPRRPHISYSIDELHQFVDNHVELAILIYEPDHQLYSPHDKAWVKIRIDNYLRKAARLAQETAAGGPVRQQQHHQNQQWYR